MRPSPKVSAHRTAVQGGSRHTVGKTMPAPRVDNAMCVEVPQCFASALKAGCHCHTFPVPPQLSCGLSSTEEPAQLRVGRRDNGVLLSREGGTVTTSLQRVQLG